MVENATRIFIDDYTLSIPTCRFICIQDGSEPITPQAMVPPAIDTFLAYENDEGGYRVVDHQRQFRREDGESVLVLINVMVERVADPDYRL